MHTHYLEDLCEGRRDVVRLAAAVADEAFWHLTRCRRTQCRRCHQDIAWYEQRGGTWLYSIESIAEIIGIRPQFLRAHFQDVVERAKARIRKERACVAMNKWTSSHAA